MILSLFDSAGDCSAPAGVSGIIWALLEAQQAALSGSSLLGLECVACSWELSRAVAEPLSSPLCRLPRGLGPQNGGRIPRGDVTSTLELRLWALQAPMVTVFSWRAGVGRPCQNLELGRVRCEVAAPLSSLRQARALPECTEDRQEAWAAPASGGSEARHHCT